MRLDGDLELSRSFGDAAYRAHGLISTAEITGPQLIEAGMSRYGCALLVMEIMGPQLIEAGMSRYGCALLVMALCG